MKCFQTTHGVKGNTKYTCTICFSVFGDFTKFKRHLQTCLKKRTLPSDDSYKAIIGCDADEELSDFKEKLKKNALLLLLKMCAQPNFPRNAAFNIINELKIFIKGATDGTHER